jgi:hypothetical protein
MILAGFVDSNPARCPKALPVTNRERTGAHFKTYANVGLPLVNGGNPAVWQELQLGRAGPQPTTCRIAP